MKANELMIGDFIYQHHPKDNTQHIVKVSTDTLDLMYRMEIGFIQEQSPLYRIIEPIPLTPEILEKNGIVYDYDQEECVADYTYIKVKGYQYHEENVLIDYYNGHIRLINDITNTVVDMNINYVHELQHALKLCGIEKTIEL